MNRSKGFLLAFVLVLLGLSALIFRPFLQYVLGAVLVAYVLYPVQRRLETYTSPAIVAFGLVVLTVASVIVPLAVVIAVVVDSADSVLESVRGDAAPFNAIESRIQELTGLDIDLSEEFTRTAGEVGSILIERSTEVFGTITFHLLGIALALFLVYYFLKDGDRLTAWLDQVIPLPGEQRRELYDEIDGVMWGVIFGHVFVGVVQGVVAGAGFVIAGVPNPFFWTAVMVVLAMLPLVGTIPVWGGAVIYLSLTNQPGLAVGLFVYAVVVVGLTDDYLRPFAVDRYAKLNPAVILLGILGGAYAFGVMGLFYGPVVLGALKATLNVLADDRTRTVEAGPD